MATRNDIILHLPFDEPANSPIAYDYSPSRADGIVKGANFVGGKSGNAIQFEGGDTCEVSQAVLSLNSEFTIFCWVKAGKITTGSPEKVIWLLNFNSGESYAEVPIELTPDLWVNTAITRKGSIYHIYVNTVLVETITNAGTLSGVALLQDYYGDEYGKGCLDDMKIYSTALSQEELLSELSSIKQLTYIIDGEDFKDFGVFVSGSDGILDRPKIKKPVSFSWDNYHGNTVDLKNIIYDVREISLSCFIKADGKNDFADKLVKFLRIFDKPGTRRLMIDIHPTKPLVYEVYCEDSVNVKKKWNDGKMVGTFTLKLKEPEPVKRVLKHMRIGTSTRTCTITISTDKLVNIYWGDGTSTFDVYGKNKTITHNYEENGEYFVVITGCIDEIQSFETNSIVIWTKL